MRQQKSHPITKAVIYLVNKLWLLIATLIILIAVIFTLLRVLLPQVDYFKADIEQWIENEYQVDVEIDDIDGEWGTKGPVFSLNGLTLKSDDGQLSLAKLDALSIHFDGIGTLLSGHITTESIQIAGVSLNFLLDRKLAVRFDTLEDAEEDGQVAEVDAASKTLLTYLFGQKKLVVVDSHITLETLTGKAFHYRISQLDIDNYEDIHQFQGQLIDDHGGNLKLVAEIYGDPSSDKSYTNLFLQGENVALAQLPILDKHPQFKPNQGQLNWRLWSDWRDGRWQSAVGDLKVTDTQWPLHDSLSNQPLIPELESFSIDFSWRYESTTTGSLVFHNGALKKQDQSRVELPEFYLLFKQLAEQDIQWEVISHEFQLASLTDYLAIPLVDSESGINPVADTGLTLNLNDLGLRLSRQAGKWKAPIVHIRFDQLDYQDLFNLPLVSGLVGDIGWSENFGMAQLAAKNTQVDLHDLFRDQLGFDLFELDLNWRLDANQQLDLRINKALAQNDDLSLSATSRFFFQDNEPNLALFAEVADVNASQKSRYLPTGIMTEALVEYLDQSVKSGTLSLAKAAVRGPLKSFPFDNEEGLFSILGFLQDARFEYLPEWPAVENFAAKLLFEGNGMDLRALAGNSGQISVNDARAVIKDYSALNTPFQLHIDATSEDNSGRDFLNNSPLNHIGEGISLLDFQGKLRTRLDMDFGLDDTSNMKVTGKIVPLNNNASVTINEFTFNQLEGALNLDQTGVRESQFTAQFKDSPISVALKSGQLESEASVIIDAQGELTASSISDIVGKKWSDLGQGKSQFSAHIQVSPPDDRDSVHLHFKSDLEGIQLDLPGELAKSKHDNTPIDVQIRLDEFSDIKISWREFNGRWWWQYDQNERYRHLGGNFFYNADVAITDNILNRYTAEINLEQTELQEWWPVLERITGFSTEREETEHLPDLDLLFNVSKLGNPYVKAENISLNLVKKTDENWQVYAKNDKSSLSLRIKDNEPWELDIERLEVQFTDSFLQNISSEDAETDHDVESPNSSNAVEEMNKWQQPGQWPSVIVNCKFCQLQDFEMGTIRLNLLTSAESMWLNGNIKNGSNHDLNVDLLWQQRLSELSPEEQAKSSKENLTQVNFELASNDFGKFLDRFDYASGVKDSGARISGKLWWSDSPWEFDLLRANGLANFNLGKGYLSEVSDAKARLFSLLSLQSLSRRLQLDFSDVYKKGFHYNGINGNISLLDNVLQSHDVYVDGSAAKVNLSGSINLKDRDIEQHALVVPQLTSSLPVLVGWAVEPTTGILVFLLNKIFEPAIEVVTQIEYRIHGTLDEINVDEVKKSKSKVKYETPETENGDGQTLETDVSEESTPAKENESAKVPFGR